MITSDNHRFHQTPPPPAAVSGVTWVHAWDTRYRNTDGSVANLVASAHPLVYSANTNVANAVPAYSPAGGPGQVQSYLTASGLSGSVNLRDCLLVHVSRYDNNSSGITIGNGLLYLGANNYTAFGSIKDYGVMTEALYYAPCQQFAVHIVRIRSFGVFGYANQRGPEGQMVDLPTNTTIDAVCIGNPVNGFRGSVEYFAIGTMSGALSNSQVAAISLDRYRKHFCGSKQKRLFFVGNSLISGVNLDYAATTPAKVAASLGAPWNVATLAVPSMTDDQLASYAPQQADALYRSTGDCLYYRETSNQAAQTSDDGAALFANVQTYVAGRRSAGWNGPIGVSGCNKWRSDVDISTKAAAYNSLMLAQFTVPTSNPIVWLPGPTCTVDADFFVHIAGLALLATSGSGGMQVDGIHETEAVKTLEAAAIYDGLDAVGVV